MEAKQEGVKGLSTITVPDGKELKKLALYCSKHGDVTEASIKMETSRVDLRGNKVTDRNCYCIACLNELLMKFQETGEIGKLAIVPVIGEKTEPEQLEFDFDGPDDERR